MAKRHRDALAIQLGAVNPSGIAISIVEACREMRAEPDHKGTAQITSDPAIRLMVHQLAFICGTSELDQSGPAYSEAIAACTRLAGPDGETV